MFICCCSCCCSCCCTCCKIYVFRNCSFLHEDHRILYDQGLGKGDVKGVFMSPTHGPKTKSKTFRESLYNDCVRRARTIVEHSYGRQKYKWSILNKYRLPIDSMRKTYLSCVTLTNIDQTFDNPMRYTKCRRKGCGYCREM